MSNVHPIFQPILDSVAPPISKEHKALESFGEWFMKWYRPFEEEARQYYHVSEHGYPFPASYTIAECRELWEREQIPPLPPLKTSDHE